MSQFFPSRLLFLLFFAIAWGCSSKKEDVAPVTPAIANVSGTWELNKQVITTFNSDGTVISSNTYIDYVPHNEIWHYVFNTDGNFEYTYQGQLVRKGTYTTTATSLVQNNAPGYGSKPTFTFSIDQVTATTLVLIAGSRTTGQESVTTWSKR